MNSITPRIQLTDAEIEARFNVLNLGVDIETDAERFSVTSDSIEDFLAARKNWAEPGRIVPSPAGTLMIERAQSARGQQRADVAVIDFGDVRLIYR